MTRAIGKRLGVSVGSGAALTLAFAPMQLGWVAFVALIPLLLALRGARGRHGVLYGFGFGAAFFAILLTWIAEFGFVAYVPLVILQAMAIALFGMLVARSSAAAFPVRLLAVPALWVGLEMARSRYPFGGFTWGALGYSQAGGGAVAHLAPVGGVGLVAFAVVAINVVLAEALTSRASLRRAGVLFAAALAAVTVPGLIPLGDTGPESGSLDVAVVQGNVPRGRFTSLGRRGGRVGEEDLVIVRNHVQLTEQLVGDAPDLIVWAENALDRDPRLSPEIFDPVVDVLGRVGAPLLTGAILDAGPKHFRNSNIVISPSGEIVARYDKMHLVPFGEYVPFQWARRVVPVLDEELPTEGIPGTEPVVFEVAGARVGTMICFESTYGDVARHVTREGAEALVVTTNNASFGTSPAAQQHLAASRMRALETGRTVVHAAISGRSAVILRDGRVLDETGLFTQALIRRALPLYRGMTPYVRFGAAIEIAFAVAALTGAVVALAARRKHEGNTDA